MPSIKNCKSLCVHSDDEVLPQIKVQSSRGIVFILLALILFAVMGSVDYDWFSLNLSIAETHEKEHVNSTKITYDYDKEPFAVFSPWKRKFPCVDKSPKSDFSGHPTGFFYIKVYKAASSTLAGIATRIARLYKHENITHHNQCYVHAHHLSAINMNLHNRDLDNSYLWTFIRDPKQRKLSNFFYFDVTRKGVNPTGPSMMKKMKSEDNFQYRYVINKESNTTDVDESIMQVLREYNFIGLVERMDESLVLLRLLLGLKAKDILYIPSKVAGSYVRMSDKKTCKYDMKEFTTPEVDKFLGSDKWYRKNKLDYALYSAVERSIDATIDMIGRNKFDMALQEHKNLMEKVNEQCAPKALFPCSAEGVIQKESCYWNDIGCGYDCLDTL